MLKKLLLLLLFSLPALAQITVTPLNQKGPIHIFRGEPWTFTTNPGLAFTWTPVAGSQYACVTIGNNNPSNSHTFQLSLTVTQDPNTSATTLIQGTPNRWIGQYSTQPVTLAASGSNNSSAGFSTTLGGAAQSAVYIFGGTSAAGSPDTLDFLEVDSPLPCFNTVFANSGIVPRSCSATANITAATASQTIILAVPASTVNEFSLQPRWHICAFSISGPAATASANLTIYAGSGPSTCGAPSGGWAITAPVGIFNTSLSGSPEVFSLLGTNALCFANGATAVTATLSISYDYW